MSVWRFVWRLSALFLWVGLGLLLLALVFPFLQQAGRNQQIRWWSRGLLHWCGVRVDYIGQVVTATPVLFVSNHVSWLDIFILNAQRATAFVAKSEIRRWPVLGWLVAGAGTVVIERGQRQAIKHVSEQMQALFRQNQAVGLFPEGTTSDGLAVGSFHASLFETALSTGVDIQPLVLRFYDGEQRSPRVAFVGEQSLLQNMWLLLSRSGVRVECEFLAVLPHAQNRQQGRVETALQAQTAIQKAL